MKTMFKTVQLIKTIKVNLNQINNKRKIAQFLKSLTNFKTFKMILLT